MTLCVSECADQASRLRSGSSQVPRSTRARMSEVRAATSETWRWPTEGFSAR